jgi:hypothetical protein
MGMGIVMEMEMGNVEVEPANKNEKKAHHSITPARCAVEFPA